MDRYRLPDLWSMHIYGYTASLRLDGQEFPIRPRYLGVTPPNVTMETRYVGISVHVYAHFRLPEGPTKRIPAMQDLGPDYDRVYQGLYEMIGQIAENPARVNARVWDLLWGIASRRTNSSTEADLHPAVKKAVEYIEHHLSEAISVTELAELAAVSPGYLVRLFQEAYGETIVGSIRRRRVERAAHLLQRSTLPIKTIAASVGMPDLQHFNKAIREEFHTSPRKLREQAS